MPRGITRAQLDAGDRRPHRRDRAGAVDLQRHQGGRQALLRARPLRRGGRARRARRDGLALRDPRRASRRRGFVDLDVVVDCSSGTYIRALARDLGAALGVGGHLTALRRTASGRSRSRMPCAVDADRRRRPARPGGRRARSCSRARTLDAEQATDLAHGKKVAGRDPADADVVAALAARPPGRAGLGARRRRPRARQLPDRRARR